MTEKNSNLEALNIGTYAHASYVGSGNNIVSSLKFQLSHVPAELTMKGYNTYSFLGRNAGFGLYLSTNYGAKGTGFLEYGFLRARLIWAEDENKKKGWEIWVEHQDNGMLYVDHKFPVSPGDSPTITLCTNPQDGQTARHCKRWIVKVGGEDSIDISTQFSAADLRVTNIYCLLPTEGGDGLHDHCPSLPTADPRQPINQQLLFHKGEFKNYHNELLSKIDWSLITDSGPPQTCGMFFWVPTSQELKLNWQIK